MEVSIDMDVSIPVLSGDIMVLVLSFNPGLVSMFRIANIDSIDDKFRVDTNVRINLSAELTMKMKSVIAGE